MEGNDSSARLVRTDRRAPALAPSRESPQGRPRKADAGARHDELLSVAMSLFMQEGFAATMDSIAAAARISKRTLYARYPDKLALFEAVVTWLAGEKTSAALSLPGDLPLREALRQYGLALFDHYTTPKVASFHRLMQKEQERFPEIYRVMREEAVRDLIMPLKNYLDQQPAGSLRAIDALFAATSYVRIIIGEIGASYASAREPSRPGFEAFLTDAADLVVDGLRARV